MQRGEVWWANLDSSAGRRPVLLLSRNEVYTIRARVTLAPLTGTIRNIPSHVLLGPEDGLPSRCVVNLDDIVTVQKTRLIERIVILSAHKMDAVDEAIAFALDLKLKT